MERPRHLRRIKFPQAGVTLIEVLVVLVVISILLTVAISVTSLFGSGQGLQIVAERMKGDFLLGRDVAASRKMQVLFTFGNDAGIGAAGYRMEIETVPGDPSSRELMPGAPNPRELLDGIMYSDAAGVQQTGFDASGLILEVTIMKTGNCEFTNPPSAADIPFTTWHDATPNNELGELYLADGSGDLLAINIDRGNTQLQYKYLEGVIP